MEAGIQAMYTKEQLLRLRRAKKWAAIAERDLSLAKQIIETFPDMAAFHLHQAAEKYLRAFFDLKGASVKKSDDIAYLILKCVILDEKFSVLGDASYPDVVTSYATQFRTPSDDNEFPATKDLVSVLDLTERIRKIVCERITEAEDSVIDE